jgi:hypothetical protein
MLPSRVSTHVCLGTVHRQDQELSCFATVTADLENLTQKVIEVLVLLAQLLNVPFRTRIEPDTSFLGSDSLCKGCMLVG